MGYKPTSLPLTEVSRQDRHTVEAPAKDFPISACRRKCRAP